MFVRRLVPLLATVVALTAACADSGDGSPDDGAAGLGDAIEVMASAPAAASAQACDVEERTLQTASEAYFALSGSPATSEDDLLAEGLLREPSELFDLDAEGNVVPAPTGPCA